MYPKPSIFTSPSLSLGMPEMSTSSHSDALKGRKLTASHTLSVLSHEPETMLLPSGEKATEATALLCALCFSALSSRDAAASTGAVRFG